MMNQSSYIQGKAVNATYLFYDIESSGLNKAFDQVMQFAAIRTDLELNEIERHNFTVQMNADIIAAPGACITHRITPEVCQKGLREDLALQKIHALMNTPGTISVGYNTLTFDDEFLRFSFYRNLLSPYTHQYANQCGRMDIYPLTVLYYLYQPEALKWPMLEGRPCLKLEALGAENALMHGQAHDAMVDVEATLKLARLLKKQAKMWQYLSGCFQKNIDQSRVEKLATLPLGDHHYPYGLFILPKLGARYRYQAPVIQLGQHHHYKNQTIWLRLDQTELQKTTLDNLDETTWSLNKKWGEPGIILPMTNHYPQHLNEERITRVKSNLAWLEKNKVLLKVIKEYHLDYKHPVHPETDVEAGLYQSAFWTREEQTLCERFQKGDFSQKLKIMEDFTNTDLKLLSLRLLGRHFYPQLPPSYQAQFDSYFNPILKGEHSGIFDFKGEQKRTLPAALSEAEQISKQQSLDTQQAKVLTAWQNVWRARVATPTPMQ